MKIKSTFWALLLALPFAACIKFVVPIPPPPLAGSSAPGGSNPYGFSMYINGTFSTFNSYTSIDTTGNEFSYTGTGDSACCTNMVVAWGLNKFDGVALTTGIYPSSGFGDENQSEWTLYVGGANNAQTGFLAFPDSVTVTNITDSTITGTFWGTCSANIMTGWTNNGPIYYDSVLNVTNGKFYLKKW